MTELIRYQTANEVVGKKIYQEYLEGIFSVLFRRNSEKNL